MKKYSSRSKKRKGIKAMKKWLIKHGLHPAYISEGILEFPTKKPGAWLTIDDRAICFKGKFPTTKEMENFTPWYKRTVKPPILPCPQHGYYCTCEGTKI